MLRFALCVTAILNLLLCAAPARAYWASTGTFKYIVALQRLNAPDLPTDVLQWLRNQTRSPEWQGALDIKEQGEEWAYCVRLAVEADGSTSFARITGVTATVRGYPAGVFERSDDSYRRLFYFARWADLVSTFGPGTSILFKVTVDGLVKLGSVVLQPYTEGSFPEVSVAASGGTTLGVSVDETGQWGRADVWTMADHVQEYVLEDAAVPGAAYSEVDVPSEGRRPGSTYVHEVSAGNEAVSGTSYQTVMYGVLVRGSDLTADEWKNPDLEQNLKDVASGMMSCTLDPSARLGPDAFILPALAGGLWLFRRRRR